MTDLELLYKLAEIKKEELNDDTTISYFDDSLDVRKTIKVKDIRLLDLSNSDINELPEIIGCLSGLQMLIVGLTHLSALPESIGELSSLQTLDVSDTQLTALPESIGKLRSLQTLNAIGTQLSALPESIGKLSSLQALYVSSTQLTVLPESIGKLSSLHKLDVRDTQLSALPESIGKLRSLQTLYVNDTQLSALPESIGKLSSLNELDVSYTPLSALPESMRCLRKLSIVDISDTKIKSINNDFLERAPIKRLFLKNLSLDRIPESILRLRLDFKPEERPGFFVENINIDDILNSQEGIYINGLSLKKQPISLFYQKRELIEQYYQEEMISVNSAKVIFLGDGDVGKTYTLKRLLNDGKKATEENPYITRPTHGVLIKPVNIRNGNEHYNIKLWDFGGQQIMHSMHRCFLTERSCYVVMISTRTDRDLMEQARYWLRTVNSFAPDCPVIVLVNQWTPSLINIDEFGLNKEFKNIQKFLYFSVVEAEDEVFLTLRDSIIDQVQHLDCYGMEFPKSWYELMTDMENDSYNYISKNTYFRKCFDKGLRYEDNSGEGIYEWLLDWFNDLGVCFSYHKNSNSQILDNYKLLNPQWLTRAAYFLINNGKNESDNGILTRVQIENILTETEALDFDDLGVVSYKSFEIDYILEILRKFQISYRIPDGRELIPVLCDENSSGSIQPAWFDQNEMLHTSYEFEYSYLPDTIIHRLMIFCYQSHYHVRYRWRKGMSVDFDSDDSCRLTAVIDSGKGNQTISIDIYSDGRIPCWQFLVKLREEILQINAAINLEAKDYINMETDGVKDRFLVEAVLRHRRRGVETLFPDNYDGEYKISDILGSAYGPVNTAVIEKISVSQKGPIDNDSINQILNKLKQFEKLLEKLDDRSRDMQILQYLAKDQISDNFSKVFHNQDAIIVLLNTMSQEPSKFREIKGKLLSGVAVSADLVTLIMAANPELARSACEEAAEIFMMIIQMLP